MADDKLRIVATVEDQFTGPLGKLEKSIKRVGDETSKQGATWKKDWAGVRDEVGKFQGVLRGFDPIFAAVGVTGFGAAMSITGMVTALRGFSGSTQQLSMLSRETGVAVDKLRAFGALGERFGVSADSMKNSVASFATSMFDLRRRWGEAYSGLQAMNLGKLAEDLVNAPNMDEALKRAVDGIQAIPEPEVRRRVSRMLFGTDDIARIAGSMTGKFSEALAQVQKEVGHLDKQTEEAAARFEQSMGRIGTAAERLKLKVLGPMLKGTADLLDDAEKNGLSGNADQQALRNQLSPFGGPEATPREKLEGRRTQVEQQLKLLEAGPRGADYQRKHDRMVEELKRVADELQKVRENGGASVSPSSFGGQSGGGSLIQKAAWGGFGSAGAGAAIPSYGGSSGGAGSGSGRGSGSGPDLGDGIHGRPFGSPGARGGAQGPIPAGQGANPGDYKEVLDFIARAEGTAGRNGDGYNTSLAYGRLLPGGAEQNLTGKTLNEIDALQTGMLRNRANRWNSSAIGRYQIVRTTLRRLRRQLGLRGDERFDEAMQDRLAAELARARGANPQGLHDEWASLGGARGHRAAELIRRIPRRASTTPGARPNRAAARPAEAGDGIRQTQPWTRAPAIPPTSQPGTTGDRADNVSLRTRDRNERASIDDLLMENEAQAGQQRQGETFQDFYRRRATTADGYTGHSWGQREDEVQRRPRDGSGDSMFGSARGMTDELNGTHRDNANRRGADGLTYEEYLDRGVQDRKPRESEFTPQRELSLDEIRKFRGPNRGVGDALMNRLYGGGATGGGTAMQMPGAAASGGRGTLHIKVDGPPGTQVKSDMSDLFRDTTVSRGRTQMDL